MQGARGTFLVGRDQECADVAEFLTATTKPAGLVLEGVAGIGKTSLWQLGIEVASRASFRVLVVRPVEAESALDYAGLGDALEGTLDEILDAVPVPQRRALEVALLLRGPDGPPPDERAVAAGFLGGLRALASSHPVLLAIDDLQWLDRATARTVAFALRRLREEPVAVLAACREGLPPTLDLPAALGAERVHRLQLPPLSYGATARMLLHRLRASPSRPTLRRIHETSNGNPFFAIELARALELRGAPLHPGDPLPVPAGLEELVGSRFDHLPAATARALGAAAALSHPTVAVAEAAAGGGEGVLDPAVVAGIVELEGDRLRFAHPVLASVAYDRVRDRPGLHRRLAAVLDDPVARAVHLAVGAVAADGETAAQVEVAARVARARGAVATAADLAAHARRLTPSDARADARRRAFTEAEYRFQAGDATSAAEIVEDLITRSAPGTERARLLSRLARYVHFRDDVGEGIELLRRALQEVGEDPALRAEIEEGLAWGLLLKREDLTAAAAHARSAARFAERSGDEAALAEALAARALTAFVIGRRDAGTMERALALEGATTHLRVLRHPSFAAGYAYACADDLERAREAFEELLRRATDSGDDSAVAPCLNHLSFVEWLAGRWESAQVSSERALEAAIVGDQRPSEASILSKQALYAAWRGDDERARELGTRALEIAGGPSFDRSRPQDALGRGGEVALWAMGVAELGVGRNDEAHRWLGPLTEALLAAGIGEPGELRCLPDEVEALVGLGQLADADRLTTRLERMARATRRASARAVAERCRGLVLAARGDLVEAVASLERAAARSASGGPVLDHARALLALGSTRRRLRRRRAAREALEEAARVFGELGAVASAGRARAELGRIGGRPSASEELTSTELRVAELVAVGRSNREVAAELTVTVRTVESTLTKVYRKLGVRSRAELVHRFLARGGGDRTA